MQLADGKRFALRIEATKAPVGAIVAFQYDELSDLGKPRNPVFLEVRDDLETWPLQATCCFCGECLTVDRKEGYVEVGHQKGESSQHWLAHPACLCSRLHRSQELSLESD